MKKWWQKRLTSKESSAIIELSKGKHKGVKIMMMNVVFKGENTVWHFYTNNVFEALDILFDNFKGIVEVWGTDSNGENIYFN